MSSADTRPGTPRSAEDEAALHRFNNIMTIPLILSAVLPLVLLPSGPHSVLAAIVNIAAWIVFVVDFVFHERRLHRYMHTWLGKFDLTVVILTAPWFLLPGAGQSKFVLVIRLARIVRLLMAGRGARRLAERLGRVVIFAGSVLVICCAVAYRAEHPTNPGFKTFGDALWWGIVTLTTVGYGDIVPTTTAGRFAGVVIMITGVAVLGVLAGSLASFFRIAPDEHATTTPNGALPEDHEQLDELKAEVSRLADEIAALRQSQV